jgi:CBS domain-containing protein
MLVEEIMSTDVVTCEPDVTLQSVVVRMLKNTVGSVVVMRDGSPAGIITETDVLQAGAVTERPFVDIPARKVASHPLVTTTGNTSVRGAIDRMQRNEVKKLPVIDGTTLVGIVTQTDVAIHFDDVTAEINERYQQRDRWDDGDAGVSDL